MKIVPNEKWILLGARRGLGKSFLDLVAPQPIKILAISRKMEAQPSANIEIRQADFSDKQNWQKLLEHFDKFPPTRLFYFAGGGPYGRFEEMAWKDHEWAWKLNFEFPAFLLHHILKTNEIRQLVRQMTFVGSSIAENSPDPMAASYSSAKHALKGLLTTIQSELKSDAKSQMDLRLFSPGYMDTSLLPANAWPRQQAGLVKTPDEISRLLFDWIQNSDDANRHLSFPSQIQLK